MNKHVLNFWRKVRRGDSAECWPWTGYTKQSGHGLTFYLGRPIHASRKAWILTHGEILEPQLCVNHKCGNALCCNPSHLYLGTRADNMGDRFGTDGITLVAARRSARRGARGRRPRLTPPDEMNLRLMREAGVPLKECASYHRISTGTALRILAKLRDRLGPERVPDARRRFARWNSDTSRKSIREVS